MLKNFLRKWLKIHDPKCYSKEEIRHMLLDVLDDCLRHNNYEQRSYMHYRVKENIGELIYEAVKQIASSQIDQLTRESWAEYMQSINREEFIDKVVARIKNKQLSN